MKKQEYISRLDSTISAINIRLHALMIKQLDLLEGNSDRAKDIASARLEAAGFLEGLIKAKSLAIDLDDDPGSQK